MSAVLRSMNNRNPLMRDVGCVRSKNKRQCLGDAEVTVERPGGRRELVLSALRPHRHPGSLQDLQDCCSPDGERFCNLPARLSGVVRLDHLGADAVSDPLSLPWGRHERQRSFNLSDTILRTCQQCVRTEPSQGYHEKALTLVGVFSCATIHSWLKENQNSRIFHGRIS